jgi:hypothetical protein
VLEREFAREGSISHEFTFERDWSAGEHELSVEIRPLGNALPITWLPIAWLPDAWLASEQRARATGLRRS